VETVGVHDNLLTQSIAEAAPNLSLQVSQLRETGSTALGPALLSSVILASQRAGSHVIVCTDGLANVGLGSFDRLKSEAEIEAAETFYVQIAEFAKLRGVVVSVISIEGAECKLENLGQVADVTGGNVSKVNPLNLTENFQAMLEKPIIATNVRVSLQLHKGMYFRNEEQVASTVTKELGSVNEDSEVSFEFSVRPELLAAPQAPAPAPEQEVPEASSSDVTASAAAPAAVAMPSSLPFQLRIAYTKPNGMKCVRVTTKAKPVTADRDQAEKTSRMAVIAANASRTCAYMAQQGDYSRSRMNAYAARNMMSRMAEISANAAQQRTFTRYVEEMSEFDQQLQRLDQDANYDQVLSAPTAASTFVPRREQNQQRSRARSDKQATVLMNAKKKSSKQYDDIE